MFEEQRCEQELEAWSEFKFANWFEAGMMSWFSEEKKRACFAPVERFIDRERTLAEDLAVVHNSLSVAGGQRMRAGLLAAFARIGRRDAVCELLDLASLTLAWDIVSILPDKITLFARDSSEDAEEFLLKSLFVTASVSMNTGYGAIAQAATRCLRWIINAPAFSNEFSGLVLTTLCNINPEELISHLLILRPYLDKVYADSEYGMRVNLVSEVNKRVGVETLVNSLQMEPVCDKYGMDWWRNAVQSHLSWEVKGNDRLEIASPEGDKYIVALSYEESFAISGITNRKHSLASKLLFDEDDSLFDGEPDILELSSDDEPYTPEPGEDDEPDLLEQGENCGIEDTDSRLDDVKNALRIGNPSHERRLANAC